MKKILFVGIVLLNTACLKIDYTHYIFHVYNQSSSELLISYETIEEENNIILKTDDNNFHRRIYQETFSGNKGLESYTEAEFTDRLFSVKLSIINGTDTIQLSKNFAPFENWTHKENYDDQMIHHDYGLIITDDMLD